MTVEPARWSQHSGASTVEPVDMLGRWAGPVGWASRYLSEVILMLVPPKIPWRTVRSYLSSLARARILEDMYRQPWPRIELTCAYVCMRVLHEAEKTMQTPDARDKGSLVLCFVPVPETNTTNRGSSLSNTTVVNRTCLHMRPVRLSSISAKPMQGGPRCATHCMPISLSLLGPLLAWSYGGWNASTSESLKVGRYLPKNLHVDPSNVKCKAHWATEQPVLVPVQTACAGLHTNHIYPPCKYKPVCSQTNMDVSARGRPIWMHVNLHNQGRDKKNPNTLFAPFAKS